MQSAAIGGHQGVVSSGGVSITFSVLHTFLWDSSATGVLCTGAAKEIVIRKAYPKAKIFLSFGTYCCFEE
jgi:hypothetical protein